MIRALFFAVALALAPAATVLAPATASAAPTSADARLEVVIREVTAFSTPYQAGMSEAGEVVTQALDGMDKALEMVESGSTDSRWVEAWERDVKARNAALRARTASLPPFPTVAITRAIGNDPSLSSRIRAFERIGVEGRAVILSSADFVDSILPLVRQVAEGDEDALMPLTLKTLAGSRLMVEAENAMLEITLAASSPDHPQAAVSRAVLAENKVLGALLTHQEIILTEGAGAKQPSLTPLLRTQAAVVRKEAANIPRFAKTLEASLAIISDPGMKARLRAALATYAENAVIEDKLGLEIEKLAASIEAGADPLDAMIPLLEMIDQAAVKRGEIQTRRISLMRQ